MKKRICVTIIGVVFALQGYTQSNFNVERPLQETKPNTFKMTSKPINSVDMNLASALRFLNMHLIQTEFTGENLTGKYFTIICKNIWNGEITDIDTIVSPKTFKSNGRQQIRGDIISFNLTGGKVENNLKIDFIPTGGLTFFPNPREYKASANYDRNGLNLYSLRPVRLAREIFIELNEFTPIFVYMPPTPQGQYCFVELNGGDIESWGKEFDIEHYLIFEIMFEE